MFPDVQLQKHLARLESPDPCTEGRGAWRGGAPWIPPGASHWVALVVGKAKGGEGGGGGWRCPHPLFADFGFKADVAATLGIAPSWVGGGGGRFNVLPRVEKTLASPSREDVTRLSSFSGQTVQARSKISVFGGNSGGIRPQEKPWALAGCLGVKKGLAGHVNPELCGRVLGIAGETGGRRAMPPEAGTHLPCSLAPSCLGWDTCARSG